jgi:FKBP-type peptidyl-prolyl cis-trans isomerase FklB
VLGTLSDTRPALIGTHNVLLAEFLPYCRRWDAGESAFHECGHELKLDIIAIARRRSASKGTLLLTLQHCPDTSIGHPTTLLKREHMSTKLLIASLACIFATTAVGAEKSALTTEKQKFSYTIGFQIAQNIKKRGLDVDAKALAQAIEDILGGKQPQLSMADMQAAMAAFQKKQLEARAALAAKNQQAGESYLADNKKKDGVVTLPSGLQYKVMKKGSGKKPTAKDTVVVNYRGTLLNGEEFDSSYARGQPATLEVGGVIPGWREALQLMPVGSKWQVVIPPDLAYGPRGAGDSIGPNETLIFEIELVEIK